MPAISTAIGLGLAGASAVAGAVGKKKAANAQAKGAEQALDVQQKNQGTAVSREEQALANERNLQQPYVAAGAQGLNSLRALLAKPGQGLLKGYDAFHAPDPHNVADTPEYKFALEQGVHALDSSAAARGDLFSGTQGTALEQYGQGLASNQYQNAYNDALNSYLTNFQTFNTNQGNTFSRLGQLAQVGQHATDVLTGSEAGTAADIGNVLVNGANSQAQSINNAAAARASGDRGIGDSIAGGLNYGADWMLDRGAQQELDQENAVSVPYNPAIWVNRGSGYPQYPPPVAPPVIPGVNQY